MEGWRSGEQHAAEGAATVQRCTVASVATVARQQCVHQSLWTLLQYIASSSAPSEPQGFRSTTNLVAAAVCTKAAAAHWQPRRLQASSR